eukprot:957909-Pyramimonas_sp.AAC.2
MIPLEHVYDPLEHAYDPLEQVRNGQWANGVALMEADLRTNPRNAKLHSALADEYVKVGRGGEAEHWYRSALQLAPNHADTWYNLGSLLDVHLGRPGYPPNHADTWYNTSMRPVTSSD